MPIDQIDLELPGKESIERKEMFLNFGPQHPGTHGLLHLRLWIDSEFVRRCQVVFGYLHRGFDKLAESKTYEQFIPIPDRLDYLSGLANSLSYVMAVEKLMDLEVPERAQYIRVLLSELQRLASHTFWVGAFAVDIGAFTPIFYSFRERENLFDIIESLAGGRMTFCYWRIGGVKEDLPEGFKENLLAYLPKFLKKINDYDVLLKENRIFLHRTRGVGVLTAEQAINFGLTGPNLRGSGVKFDLRKNEPYLVYDKLDFDIPVGVNGDTYDRYLVRIQEMRESAKIIKQVLEEMPDGPIISDDPRVKKPSKEQLFNNVESLIHYCYITMEGIQVPPGEVYMRIEGSRGEFGYYIVSDGTTKPYRLFIRVPTKISLTPFPELSKGKLIADLPILIGGFDTVLGETDK